MKTNRFTYLFIILSGAILWSCGKMEYFKSESEIKKQLEGDWNLIPIPRTARAEVWNFHDGTLLRMQALDVGLAPVAYDTATYTIKTSLLKVRINIDNFKIVLDKLNGEWEIVQLDKSFLVMATDHDGATGILEREFQKKN